MNLSKEEALRLHRKMWSDMREKLGDCPSAGDREAFKIEWCNKHFPHEFILNNCFLCEYTKDCYHCPINWSRLSLHQLNRCYAKYKGVVDSVPDTAIFLTAPISEILALPEK